MSGGRRFLLTGVVSRYALEPSWNREELAEDLERMVELFGGLGYAHVPLMGLDPTWLQVQDALRDFATASERQPDDYVAVYRPGTATCCRWGRPGRSTCCCPLTPCPRTGTGG